MTFRFTKILVLIAALSFTVSTSSLHAQARPSPATQVLSVDVVPLLTGSTLSLQYEFKSDPTSSWLIRANFWPSPAPEWNGFGIGAAYRFYIADSRALTGLSAAPAVDLLFFSQSSENETVQSHFGTQIGVAIGGDLAYKWIFSQFAVEPVLGLRVGLGASQVPGGFQTIYALIGCSLGYAW
ncbi:MAG TPA: hypothetical protein VGM92_06385 [Candidatus Kapabacteria bacterium]|jgi:hypothetical protein